MDAPRLKCARGRAQARPRAFEVPDLPSSVVDALTRIIYTLINDNNTKFVMKIIFLI